MLTLGEAIRAAHCESLQAEQRRNDLLARAREAGVTVQALGHLLGVAPSTAYRWSGIKLHSRSEPALSAEILDSSADSTARIILETKDIAPASGGTDRGRGSQEGSS